ncbi:thiamine pyrophosphate-binding protein [Bradyrhizobium sp. LHD-71]|uniref:thiamine pyrophosphate-binding protein n=1 Tax=Bradyrhizobium sp. LHD-71 TaxID=3072141 RepID=UPI00280F6977|nr:thiamine pyrophosphate-binding protein [Bradyrhizobium sp. LHD-71]MDQ8732689.1 thiamine pyrophosphate-binding protein [Bradyrhizobium sp. LHD-71]
MALNSITGRSAFLSLLKDEGITHLFGNPGTTELPIMHALKDHPDLTYVMGMQESLVVYMADGFSRASGRLSACNVHVAPGLGNAMGALFAAKFTGTPIILTAGQQEQGHGLTEPLLYDPLVPIAQPLVKWAVEVTRLEDLPRIVRRAAKVAMTPPTGPVFISLPGDILNSEAGIDLASTTRIDTRVRPSDEVIDALAERILKAERPVLLCGDELVKSDALEEAAQLSELLGCPAFQSTIPYGAHFLSERPCFVGALSREQKQVRDALSPYDTMIVLGSDVLRMSVWSEVDPKPDHLRIVQIGLVDWEIGKNYPAEFAVKADVRETIKALIPVLQKKGGDALAARARKGIAALAESNWTAKREAAIAGAKKLSTARPIHGDWLTHCLVEAMPKDAILVNEGLTSARLANTLFPFRDRWANHGNAAGGIGWALPAAIGVQLAHPNRPVTCLSGDGSAMYSVQALWTAANQKLPITYVICNNGGYRIIKQRLKSFHGNDHFIGMDFKDPALDWVGLAGSMGMKAVRVTEPDQLADVLKAACSGRNGPTLVDVVVDGVV